jgi:5,10-methylenetetrahydrofolate reductase
VIQGQSEVAFQPPVDTRRTPESPQGSFERACRSGDFVVTVEVTPPDSADPRDLLARAERFRGLADAINITDGAGGNCHMSSVAASAVLVAQGLPAVYQITCRDRNRIAIQGDLLGAAALGVQNILCLTGDDVSQGDQPQAKPVFDLDAVSLLHIARGMCDQGRFASGRPLQTAPDLFIGATANPFVPPHLDRVANLEKKIVAGARFIQTQFCFDLVMFEDFMREVRRRDLHRQAQLLVGVGTLGSAKALAWMAAHVPGVHVPQRLLERIGQADDQRLEGKRVCIELIRALRQVEGVAGVHVMGYRNEEILADVIVESAVRRPAAPVEDSSLPQ